MQQTSPHHQGAIQPTPNIPLSRRLVKNGLYMRSRRRVRRLEEARSATSTVSMSLLPKTLNNNLKSYNINIYK
jgi:hypothetical protein